MVTVNVSIPMNTKLNCAIRLNASYAVILPPPSIGEVVNRPPCLCSCYGDCNIFLSLSQFQQPLLQKMPQHINKNAEKETESRVTLCLYQSSTNFDGWQAPYIQKCRKRNREPLTTLCLYQSSTNFGEWQARTPNFNTTKSFPASLRFLTNGKCNVVSKDNHSSHLNPRQKATKYFNIAQKLFWKNEIAIFIYRSSTIFRAFSSSNI